MGCRKRHCNTLSPRLREDLGRKSDRLRVRCDMPGSCLSRHHDGLDSQSRCERKSHGLGLATYPQFDAILSNQLMRIGDQLDSQVMSGDCGPAREIWLFTRGVQSAEQ